MVVAIDGPAGVGKSSVSFQVAKKLDIMLIDTGAMYRSVALRAFNSEISNNTPEILELAKNLNFSFKIENNKNIVFVNGEDVSALIRTENVSKLATDVAKNGDLRKILVEKQQKLAENSSVVMEGRDIGTVVFPNADVKIFLSATPEVKAQRRYKELKEKDPSVSFESILEAMVLRDKQDSERAESPLRKADDAVEIDTSDKTIDEVISNVLSVIETKIS
ncbi:(d)CMP kinase [bacterium]|nr:(d)CMP kinase [bacterium]